MRTTVQLPDEVLRQAKARAALDGIKLQDLIARFVSDGLSARTFATLTPLRRSPLPVVTKASGNARIPALTNAEIQAILDEEDAERSSGSAGH